MSALNRAINGLKEWTDPAVEGSPYDPFITYAKYPSIKKHLSFRRKISWRV